MYVYMRIAINASMYRYDPRDKIRNEYIRGTVQVGHFGEKTREAGPRWFGGRMRGVL